MSFLAAIRSYNTSPNSQYICQDTSFSLSPDKTDQKLSIYQISEQAQKLLHKTCQNKTISNLSTAEKDTVRTLHTFNHSMLSKMSKKHSSSLLISVIYSICELFYNLFFYGRFATNTNLLTETKDLIDEHIAFDIETKDLTITSWDSDVLKSIFNPKQFSKIERSLFDNSIDSFEFRITTPQNIGIYGIEKRISPNHDHANRLNDTYALSFRIRYYYQKQNYLLPYEFKVRVEPNLAETDYYLYQEAKEKLNDLDNISFEESGLLRFQTKESNRSIFMVRSTFGTKAASSNDDVCEDTVKSLSEAICKSFVDVAISKKNFHLNFDYKGSDVHFVFNEISVLPQDKKTLLHNSFHNYTIFSKSHPQVDVLHELIKQFPQHKDPILDTVKKYPYYHRQLLTD